MAAQCEMIIGFLVPHRCPNRAVTTCIKCNRQFCEEHLRIEPGGLICTACLQGLEQPIAVPQTARDFDEGDLVVFEDIGGFDDEDDIFADLS